MTMRYHNAVAQFQIVNQSFRRLEKNPGDIRLQEQFCIQLRLLEPEFATASLESNPHEGLEALILQVIDRATDGIALIEDNKSEHSGSIIKSINAHIDKSFRKSLKRIQQKRVQAPAASPC